MGSACTVKRTDHFGVDVGYGVYVRIYQRPSAQLVIYNDAPRAGEWYCGGDERCTLQFLRERIAIDWLGDNPIADFDYFFDDAQASDLAGALDQVRGTNPQRCLMLHRNTNPLGDRHNWTSSSAGGSCREGVLVTL